MSGSLPRRRRRVGRNLGVVAAVGATAAAVASASGLGLGQKSNDNTKSSSSSPSATAAVTKQTLVDAQTETGELSYGSTTTVAARLSGTVTALPAVGALLKSGQVLYQVDNKPVLLLRGNLPSYRELSSGVEGADVEQFERNLRALGYTGFTVDDEYTSNTAAAVEEWQEDLGLPETGKVDLGRVHYATGSVRVDSVSAALGDQVQSGTDVFVTSGSTRVVTVELEMSDRRLARKGATVKLTGPDGRTVPGTVTAVDTIVDAGEEGNQGGGETDPTTKLEVTITPHDAKAFAGLDDAAVDVRFTASERKNVLTVPVAALLALPQGGYAVQIADGTNTRLVPVETGMFASGRVEVTGDGLRPGTKVGIPV
jgi:membrane fusion protein, multidrug efflux system